MTTGTRRLKSVVTVALLALLIVGAFAIAAPAADTPRRGRVLPATLPLVSVVVDPDHLARVLKVAAGFREEGARGVALHFWPSRGLLGVTAHNPETGQAFDALCVPLVDDGKEHAIHVLLGTPGIDPRH